MTTTMLQNDGPVSEVLIGNLGARINLRGYDGVEREMRGNATNAVGAALSSGNYGLIEQTTHGKNIAVPLIATSATAALTPANSVFLVDEAGPSIGAGRYLRLYDTVGTDYVQLSSDADGGVVLTGSSGSNAGLLTISNLTFTGTGNRIRGPYDNATITNRPFFQSSATNGDTNVSAMPSGSNTISKFQAFNNSTPGSASIIASMEANNTEMRLTAASAAGAAAAMQLYSGATKVLDLATTGNATFIGNVNANGPFIPGGQSSTAYGTYWGQLTASGNAGGGAGSTASLTAFPANSYGLLHLVDTSSGGYMFADVGPGAVNNGGASVKNVGAVFDASGTDVGAVWAVYLSAGVVTVRNRRADGTSNRQIRWQFWGGG